MLFTLITLLLLIEGVFLLLRRDRRSVFLFLSSLSLFTFILGILLYIAKKGGITEATSVLLYGLDEIRRWMQYRVMTLGQLGYIVALGRFLFPLFILLAAFSFSYFPLALRMKRLWWTLAVLPVLSLIIYIPPVFKAFIAPWPWILKAAVYFSRTWIYLRQ